MAKDFPRSRQRFVQATTDLQSNQTNDDSLLEKLHKYYAEISWLNFELTSTPEDSAALNNSNQLQKEVENTSELLMHQLETLMAALLADQQINVQTPPRHLTDGLGRTVPRHLRTGLSRLLNGKRS